MEFKMPDIGEGVMEGEVVKWLVKDGDSIVEDQPLVEVMTDKATVVIPCPARGTVSKIRVGEGQTARVGQVLVEFDTGAGGGAMPKVEAPRTEPSKAEPPRAEAPKPAPPAPRPEPAAPRPAPSPRIAAAAAYDNGRGRHQPPARPGGARALAAPATRRLARENGIDLEAVAGTGPNGRITRQDLVRFLEEGPEHEEAAPAVAVVGVVETPSRAVEAPPREAQVPEAAPRPAAPPPRPSFPEGPRPETRVPVRGMRKRISENMRRSKDHAAHFTYVEECDLTELVKLRDSMDDLAKGRGVRLTYLPFIVKAIVAGLKEFPYLNSTYDEEAQEIVLKGYYNLGIAAATEEALVVPVVKDCDRRSILEIAGEINRLGDAARTNTLRLEDLQGSTFTITSLGAIGGILATPVINYPEVAIVGVHKIRKRPVVREDQIVIRDICYLTISIDHRVVDGHIGAQFMQRVVSLLEDPRLLLLGA